MSVTFNKDAAIKFCRDVINDINPVEMANAKIYRNELIDFLYLMCQVKFDIEKEWKLSYKEIDDFFSYKQKTEQYISEVKKGNIKIIGIDKTGKLILK